MSEQRDLPKERGGGTLKYAYYGFDDSHGKQVITRYSIAWINHDIYSADNGRVLGYDNAHDFHHRHVMGNIEPVDFSSFEDTFDRFTQEWQAMVQKLRSNTP